MQWPIILTTDSSALTSGDKIEMRSGIGKIINCSIDDFLLIIQSDAQYHIPICLCIMHIMIGLDDML